MMHVTTCIQHWQICKRAACQNMYCSVGSVVHDSLDPNLFFQRYASISLASVTGLFAHSTSASLLACDWQGTTCTKKKKIRWHQARAEKCEKIAQHLDLLRRMDQILSLKGSPSRIPAQRHQREFLTTNETLEEVAYV